MPVWTRHTENISKICFGECVDQVQEDDNNNLANRTTSNKNQINVYIFLLYS